jgi:hypothetical protein
MLAHTAAPDEVRGISPKKNPRRFCQIIAEEQYI